MQISRSHPKFMISKFLVEPGNLHLSKHFHVILTLEVQKPRLEEYQGSSGISCYEHQFSKIMPLSQPSLTSVFRLHVANHWVHLKFLVTLHHLGNTMCIGEGHTL